jgi:hypothetical protein
MGKLRAQRNCLGSFNPGSVVLLCFRTPPPLPPPPGGTIIAKKTRNPGGGGGEVAKTTYVQYHLFQANVSFFVKINLAIVVFVCGTNNHYGSILYSV